MDKHRIELFSDGVFAIVLTLLVLDLRVPFAHGLGALREVWPSLVVHIGSFILVSTVWVMHQAGLERVTEFNYSGVRLNLICLFWPTLIPFGARNAAERPLDPLGPSLLAATAGCYILSMLLLRLGLHSTIGDAPGGERWVRRRFTIYLLIALANILAAGLAWWKPWLGYVALAPFILFTLTASHPAEVERHLRNGRAPAD